MNTRTWVSQTVFDQFGAIVTEIGNFHKSLDDRTNKYQIYFDEINKSLDEGLKFLNTPEMPTHSILNPSVSLDPAVTLSTIIIGIKAQLRLMIGEKGGLKGNEAFYMHLLDIVENLGKFRNACEREIEAKQPKKEVKNQKPIKLDVEQSAIEERKVPISLIQDQIDLIGESSNQKVSCFSIFSHAARFEPKKMLGSGAALIAATSDTSIEILSHFIGAALDSAVRPNLFGFSNQTLVRGAIVGGLVVVGSGLGAKALYNSMPESPHKDRDVEEGNNSVRDNERAPLLKRSVN